MERRRVAIWLVAAVLAAAPLTVRHGAAQEGYAIDGEKITVGAADQWEKWLFPVGTLDIGEQVVRPHYVSRDLNACLDVGRYPLGAPAEEKEGGIVQAGSNEATADRILDGDPATYWEPDVNENPGNWFVVVDLGRLVSATRLVLRFAEDSDPFYQFRVLVADGDATLGASANLAYHLVGRTERPNVHQREFTFEMAPYQSHDSALTTDEVRFVQVIMTDSRRGKAEEVADLAAYEALPPVQQGDVEHLGRSRTGREWVVTEAVYALLEPSQQGPIRYYRREQPRLAELEVWTLGENVALGLLLRGGRITSQGTGMGKTVDGDYHAYYNFKGGFNEERPDNERRLQFDLGGFYWIDRVQILGWPGLSRLGLYLAKISDGSLAPDGSLAWTQVADRMALRYPPLWQEVRFDLSKVRFVIFDYLLDVHNRYNGIAELHVFGEGYQPEVVLESPLMDLGNSRNLTTLHWDGDTPAGTRVEVATRTGDLVKTVTHYYRKDGTEISQKDWEKTIKPLRGPTSEEVVVDDDNWSSWSKPHEASGEQITSPSPRRFVKAQVKLVSDDPDVSAQIRRLELHFSEPWVDRALGEMHPVEVSALAEETELTFFVRPDRGFTDPGVDEVLLVSSGRDSLKLAAVRLGAPEDFAPDGGGQEVDLAGVTVKATAPESLWVQLTEPVPRNQVVAVDVSTVLFGHALAFTGRVGNRTNPGAWQRVEAGDAAPQIDGSSPPGIGLIPCRACC